MTGKRFGIGKIEYENDYDIWYVDKICDNGRVLSDNEIVKLLNQLHEENKELKKDNDIKFWKNELMIQWNTTQIISHELSLAIENGYEISEDFQKYLDELKEKHEENVKKIERLKI